MPVRQLSESIVNRIAAGEVVERPASVVKELVENALDAGARRIDVLTDGGGRRLIRVTDDGEGMTRADLELAVDRHATSKLPGDDLLAIRTLGFRGEALPAIGAVARLTITTRHKAEPHAWTLTVDAGSKSEIKPAALGQGTTVEVRDLFYATPARLKFLKTDRSEAEAVREVVRRLAMSRPDVAFTLAGEERAPVTWAAANDELGRLGDVLGSDFRANALALGIDRDGVRAEVRPEHVAQAAKLVIGCGPGDGRALLAGQRERNIRPAHGEAPHHLAHGLRLAAVGLEEFQPRRRRVKKIAHLDAGALAQRRRLHVRFLAGIDGDRPCMRLSFMARGDRQARHRADRRQCLTAKAERVDGQQIVASELRGGVTIDRQRQIDARHALAVVADADQPSAAAVGEHVDAARAGVEGILNQFFDDARRPLDHLPGGDAVDDGLGQLADGHE